MALEKKEIDNFLPNGFETLNQEGYKENFSDDKIQTGYEKDVPDLVSGPNLNNLIDKIGKNFNVLDGIVKFFNNMPIGSLPTVNNNNQLDYVNNNFLNKTQLTNCILAAPNGVATYSGSDITIKQGLKVLIPNERNADKSLKNIELTLDEDISISGTELKGVTGNLLVSSDKTLSINNKYVEGYVLPSNFTGVFRNLDENTCYFYSNGTPQKERSYANIGNASINAEGNVTFLNPYQPVSLAKEQDIDGVWVGKYLSLAQLSNMTSSDVTFDLSDYLPKDGNVYEVLVSGNVRPALTVNKYVNLYVKSDIITDSNIGICGNRTTVANHTAEGAGGAVIPIGGKRTLIRVGLSSSNAEGKYTLYVSGYRKVR